jgi:ATP-dependent Clp protease ATP-binding subunit ClpB
MITEDIVQAVYIAKQLAKENTNAKYFPAHLLKALLNPQFNFIKQLDAAGLDVFYMDEWADIRISECAKATRPTDDATPDSSVTTVLEEAEVIAGKLNKDIDFYAVLAALVTSGVGFTHDQLKSLPVTPQDVNNISGSGVPTNDKQHDGAKKIPGSTSVTDKYCSNKLEEVKNNPAADIIGRDEELKVISEVLSRKLKPHIIITGESGVGKSFLVEGFCSKIANNTALTAFNKATVYELNTGALFAGASYKGEVEDRLQKLFNELRQHEKPILFIDDIHELFDANQSAGIAGIIRSELSKGIITFIGATTTEKFRKTIAKDDALSRRFETLEISEPTPDVALRMIKNVIHNYHEHHNFIIDEDGLREAIRLSKRYLKEKSLPDSALDLIDRTMSALKVTKETLNKDLPGLREQATKIATLTPDEKDENTVWLHTDILGKTGKFTDTESFTDSFLLLDVEKRIEHINGMLDKLETINNSDNIVLSEHLATVVSGITGIPAGKVKSNERERLLDIENTLKQRVIGQDHAVKVVADAILESRSGLTKPGQPIGSFFFLGPTGTGKTELAKSLADFLFGDENAIIRLDMSEFKEEHSAALLYGAPPGYVGYEEGGLLVNKIRQNPYSIVLFDEIEKAHKSVFDVFLQILDEGKLHDRLGKEGDFSNAVILFTSNIGSDHIVQSFEKGIIPKSNDLIQLMTGFFRPEFLGRLTEIIPFAPISKSSVSQIFDIHLKKELVQLLEKLNMQLEISEADRETIALKGFSPEYGARPIKGTIRNQLKRPLSKMIIAEELKKGDTVFVSLDENDEIKFQIQQNEGSLL